MAQTLTQILLHLVFSTKNRADLITPAVEPDLYAYMGGITRNLKCALISGGGTSNHIHLLVVLGKTITVADLLMHTKKESSKWMKSKGVPRFAWQEGYGAFSIGESGRGATMTYIKSQKKHHIKMTFEDELVALCRKYKVEYDPRYLLD
jgi:putative transposase